MEATVGTNGTVKPDTAKLTSPLVQAVDSIIENPQYLTEKQAIGLAFLLKKHFPKLPEFTNGTSADIKGQTNSLRAQLIKMGESLDRMLNSAISGDTTDYKRLFDAQSNYFKLLAKFNDALAANDRLNVIEVATFEALSSLGNKDISERFMVIFREKLLENSKKLDQNE